MTDRPILFSAPMIRALLAGTKAQTRRVIKPRHNPNRPSLFDGTWSDSYVLDPGNQKWREDAYTWRVGDRLWVREAHHRTHDSATSHLVGYDSVEDPNFGDTFSREIPHVGRATFFPHSLGGWGGRHSRNFPGIHMPRWASRLTLVVTDSKVERLQDINTADAIDEGIEKDHAAGMPNVWGWRDYLRGNDLAKRHFSDPRESYRTLWNSINGPGSWEANPWVVALTFTVHKQNIDAMKEVA